MPEDHQGSLSCIFDIERRRSSRRSSSSSRKPSCCRLACLSLSSWLWLQSSWLQFTAVRWAGNRNIVDVLTWSKARRHTWPFNSNSVTRAKRVGGQSSGQWWGHLQKHPLAPPRHHWLFLRQGFRSQWRLLGPSLLKLISAGSTSWSITTGYRGLLEVPAGTCPGHYSGRFVLVFRIGVRSSRNLGAYKSVSIATCPLRIH